MPMGCDVSLNKSRRNTGDGKLSRSVCWVKQHAKSNAWFASSNAISRFGSDLCFRISNDHCSSMVVCTALEVAKNPTVLPHDWI